MAFRYLSYCSVGLLLFGCGLNNTGSNQAASASSAITDSPSTKITSEFAESLLLPTAMSRMSAMDAVSKVIELFPTAVLDNPNASGAFTTSTYPISSASVQAGMRTVAATDQMNPETYNVTTTSLLGTQAYASLVSLSAIDRSTGPLALLSARTLFENLCTQAQATPTKSILFNATSPTSVLLDGETLPADPDTQVAFIVARRAWNYPYTADSDEVQHLKKAYTASSAANQKKQICLAALLSDQFWEGNPGQMDIPNHVTLSLANKRPSLQDLVKFSKDPSSFTQYVKDLQATSPYMDNVLRWHASRLGLRPLGAPDLSQGWGDKAADITGIQHEAWYYSVANFGAANSVPLGKIVESYMQGIDGCPAPAKVAQSWLTSITGQTRNGVAPDMNQAFDPRTTGIFWEQYETIAARYKTVAGWVLKPFLSQFKTAVGDAGLSDSDFITKYSCTAYTVDPRWLQCKGEAYNGVQYGLDQIRNTNAMVNATNSKCTMCTTFTTPSLPAPPQDTTIADVGARVLRKAVRYSPSGRQDGYSEIKSFFTNKPIKACNSLARYMTTCAYTPTTGYELQQFAYDLDRVFTGLIPMAQWTAAGMNQAVNPANNQKLIAFGPFHMSQFLGLYVNPALETFAQPSILQGFRCGEANATALSATTAFDNKAAFPGYDYLPNYTAGDENITTWLPATWKTSYAAVNQNAIHTRMFPSYFASDRYVDTNHPSEYVWASMFTEWNREPYRLIKAAITNQSPVDGTSVNAKPDYSTIVTGKFTYVPKYMELLYRTRGESSYIPKGYTDSSSYTDLTLMTFAGEQSKFSEIPARIVTPTSTVGTLAYDRPAAGILQMPAVIAAMAPGSPRSMASRVFARFLCGDANIYDPNADGTMDQHMASFNRINSVSSLANPMGGIYGSGGIYATDGSASSYKTIMTTFVQTHVSHPECMSCHANLDPLGLALFKYYGSNIAGKQSLGTYTAYSELNIPLNGGVGGNRFPAATSALTSDATIGTGMFLGESVSGFAGVGDKLSRSRLFYACATQDAFQNMFGRMPTTIEARKAYKNVVDRFMEDRDYNNMILGLVEIEQNLGGE